MEGPKWMQDKVTREEHAAHAALAQTAFARVRAKMAKPPVRTAPLSAGAFVVRTQPQERDDGER